MNTATATKSDTGPIPPSAPAALPTTQRRISLVEKFAHRFSIEPDKLLGIMKATAFRQSQGEISNEQLAALLVVADQYGLNPFTREIFAFPDKGGIVPVVGVDGWSRIVNDHEQFNGVTLEVTGDGPTDWACTATMHRKDRAEPIVITEYFAEVKRETAPWKSHPRRMLRHKAFIQCARIAFGFAGIYDEDEAERIVEGEVVSRGGVSTSTADLNAEVRGQRPATTQEVVAEDAEFTEPGAAEDRVEEKQAAATATAASQPGTVTKDGLLARAAEAKSGEDLDELELLARDHLKNGELIFVLSKINDCRTKMAFGE